MKNLGAIITAALLLVSLNTAVTSAAIATPSSGDGKALNTTAAQTGAAETKPVEDNIRVSINLAARSLAVFDKNNKIGLYPIGPGKTSSPTPTGYYNVQYMEKNPDWVSPHDGKVIKSGPECPIGYRWIGFNGTYGIHGTNRPDSIGDYVSDGCVRMNEEAVEAVYDLVKVGTPVEITYNRIVVEKLADSTVVYYIYPDGYGWQPLTVAEVNKWLVGFGVGGFVSDADIAAKIDASDGNPTYIAQAYPLYVNGKKLKSPAVRQGGETYLPVIDIAQATGIDVGYIAETQTLTTKFAGALGYDKKDVLYCTTKDVKKLFALTGGQNKKNDYVLKSAISDAAKNATQSAKSVATEKKNTTTTARSSANTRIAVGSKASSKSTTKTTTDSWITPRKTK